MRINKKTGFTLVEVFLVASLFGAILLAIFSAYTAGMRVWRSVRDLRLAEDRKFVIAVEKVKREISSYIRDFEDINFEGDKKELSFPCMSGYQIVTVTYSFDKGRKALTRKEQKFSESLKDEMEAKKRTLLEADDINFSYLLYDDTENEGSWVTKFSEEEKEIPDIVKVDIRKDDRTKTVFVFIPK